MKILLVPSDLNEILTAPDNARPDRYAGGLPQPVSRLQDRDELTPIPRAHSCATAPRPPVPPRGLLACGAPCGGYLLRSDAAGRPGIRLVPHLHRTCPGCAPELRVGCGPARPGAGRGRPERHLPAARPTGLSLQRGERGGSSAPAHPGPSAGPGARARRRHPQWRHRLLADRRRRARGPLPTDLPGPHPGCGRRAPAGAHRAGGRRRRRPRHGAGRGHSRGAGLHRLRPLAAAGVVVGLPAGAHTAGRRVPRCHPGAAHPHPGPGRGAHQRPSTPGGRDEPTRCHGPTGRQPARHPAH